MLIGGLIVVGAISAVGQPKASTALKLPANAFARLNELQEMPKFAPSSDGTYMGVIDLGERKAATLVVNRMIASIEKGLHENPTKEFVLAQFELSLGQLELYDTEDREKACEYFENVMDAVGLESSDGLLNTWLYGFDPKDLAAVKSGS